MATRVHADGVEMLVGDEEEDQARPVHPFLDRFVWRESLIDGGFAWQADFKADVWQEWTPLLLGKDKPTFRFRMFTQEDGDETTTEWRTATPDSSRASFRGTTLIGSVVGGDRRLDMMQQHRVRAFTQQTVDEIVRLIAADYDLEARVQAMEGRGDHLQVQESDWHFLRRIVYQSASANGRGDVFLWVDDDRLVLGAPDYQAPADRRHDMSIVENRVDKFALRYAGREIDRRGGARLVGWGFDWDKKLGLSFDLDGDASQTHPVLAGRVPRRQSDGLRYHPVIKNTTSEVEAETRGRWGRYAPRYFSLRVDTRPDLTLRPGSILELEATLGQNRETPFLGRFAVLEVMHEYVQGSATTTAVCYRREAFAGSEEAQGSSAADVRDRDPFSLAMPNQQPTVLRAEVLP